MVKKEILITYKRRRFSKDSKPANKVSDISEDNRQCDDLLKPKTCLLPSKEIKDPDVTVTSDKAAEHSKEKYKFPLITFTRRAKRKREAAENIVYSNTEIENKQSAQESESELCSLSGQSQLFDHDEAVGSIQTNKAHISSRTQNRSGHFSKKMVSKSFGVDMRVNGGRTSISKQWKLGVCHASKLSSSVADPIHAPSDSQKKTNETALILIRHGESLWNEKNLFTGCVDVPLTSKGIEEAIEAGKRISNIPIDMIYTSTLIRAQMTAMLAMTQHRRKKVPIIMHTESERANAWSQVFSDDTKKQSIPVVTAWQLNERMYGELQGLNKQETADKYGKEKVHEWRRSYDIPPPNGESLEMCAERAVAYFKENIEPQLLNGKHVMIAAHGNSLRSIIMYLDKLTSQEVISLELSTGIPMLYIFKEGKFIRRGSPVAPTEASVYAYTKSLALYRQKLDASMN